MTDAHPALLSGWPAAAVPTLLSVATTAPAAAPSTSLSLVAAVEGDGSWAGACLRRGSGTAQQHRGVAAGHQQPQLQAQACLRLPDQPGARKAKGLAHQRCSLFTLHVWGVLLVCRASRVAGGGAVAGKGCRTKGRRSAPRWQRRRRKPRPAFRAIVNSDLRADRQHSAGTWCVACTGQGTDPASNPGRRRRHRSPTAHGARSHAQVCAEASKAFPSSSRAANRPLLLGALIGHRAPPPISAQRAAPPPAARRRSPPTAAPCT